jgi:hypothetical protein
MVNIASESDNPFAFSFQWPVAARYELQSKPINDAASEDGPPSTSQILADSGPRIVRRSTETNKYPPRAIPDLHRKFVQLKDTPEDVFKFVRDYGFLGVSTLQDGDEIESESVSAILGVRDHMRSALDAFNELRREESRTKRTLMDMRDEGLDARPEQVAEVAGYARQFAGGLFNKWATPRFVLRLRSTERGGLALHAEPQTLLGFMWLRVAEELAGEAQYTYCMWCQNPILISGKDGARADKKTCSGACRHAMNAHLRKIKAEAESKTAKPKTAQKPKQAKRGSK